MVHEKLIEAIQKHRKLKGNDIRNNQTASLEKFDQLENIDLQEIVGQFLWGKVGGY
jgi:hypothetical protein